MGGEDGRDRAQAGEALQGGLPGAWRGGWWNGGIRTG